MAESFGIASGIAGIISLTIEVFGLSYEYVNGVRDASSSSRRFLQELESLQTVLRRVEQLPKGVNQIEVFGEEGSCLLSIQKSNEYVTLLQKVRDKLKQRQTSSSLKNQMKALTWPFTEKETLSLTESLHRHLEIYNTTLAVDNLRIGVTTLSEVRQITTFQADSQAEAVLDWLSPLNMYQRQQDTLSRRRGLTGSWLLEDPIFQRWCNEGVPQRTLWCPGNPGTGKTVITSVVIDYLLNNRASEYIKIAYIYCDYKDQAAQTASNLIACLARQIIGRPKVLPLFLTALHQNLEQQKRRPSFDELKRLLVHLCNQYAQTYIIVDALDECEAFHERRLLLPTLEALPDALTRLFVTSRPNNEDISQPFARGFQITIAAPEVDLREYILERMKERRDFVNRLSPELKEEITSTISTESCGMFLLAALQVDRIFATRTIRGIKSALTSMPDRLDELYRQTLERIQKQAGDDGALGMRVLSWITHARRPLSVNELRHGLAVEYSDNEEDIEEFDEDNLLSPGSLVDVCAGLVFIDPTSQIIRLVHYTTQEYFDKARLHLFKGAEVDISRACLTYLSYDRNYETREIVMKAFQSHPFLNYACYHWFSHVKNCQLGPNSDSAISRAVARFKSSDRLSISVGILFKLLGLKGAVLFRALHKAEPTPLNLASGMGLEELVAVLLDNSTGPCPGLESALVLASSLGHLNVVKLLLQNGAPIESTISVSGGPLTTLEAACSLKDPSTAIFLIEIGADVNDGGSSRPLHIAVCHDHAIFVDLLLKKGANVNLKDSCGQTACHLAVHWGKMASVMRLLDASYDLEITDGRGRTALHHAARGANVPMIEFLLDRGADASAKDSTGKTARDWLESTNHEGYRQLLKKLVRSSVQLEHQSSTSATDDPTENEAAFPGQEISGA